MGNPASLGTESVVPLDAAGSSVPAPRRTLGPSSVPSLRVVLALAFGTLGLLSTVVLTVLMDREATRRLESEIGAQMAELAAHTGRALDLGMYERWHDIQVVASLDTLRDPALPVAAKRAVLRRIQGTFPSY